MEIRKAERKLSKIKMAIKGGSGSGKTLSSLLLSKGLSENQFKKVIIIDTENQSADLYAHIGDYNVLSLKPPYSPEKYIEAIDKCIASKMEVIIIDSISHCWNYLLDFHANLPGNTFSNWAKVNPRQGAFINKILQCDAHVIATLRTKQDYVLNQVNGKYVPEKVGLKAIQRDDLEYEFTIVFDIDSKHFAKATKDRTNLFTGSRDFQITPETGSKILHWTLGAKDRKELVKQIDKCFSTDQLLSLYKNNPHQQEVLKDEFTRKKQELNQIIENDSKEYNGNKKIL